VKTAQEIFEDWRKESCSCCEAPWGKWKPVWLWEAIQKTSVGLIGCDRDGWVAVWVAPNDAGDGLEWQIMTDRGGVQPSMLEAMKHLMRDEEEAEAAYAKYMEAQQGQQTH